MYDFAVYLGRFQPLHNGHVRVINEALQVAKKVIVIVGSADRSRSLRNPFTYQERHSFLTGTDVFNRNLGNIFIAGVPDQKYNELAWIRSIEKQVDSYTWDYQSDNDEPSVALIGHDKDDSTYYMNLFPEWDVINLPLQLDVDATRVRESFFLEKKIPIDDVPANVAGHLLKHSTTDTYLQQAQEYAIIRDYKKSWEKSPYTPIFVTTDAVVTCGGNVLLVERKSSPGKGLYALPGGFLEPTETLEDGMLRELDEETKIKVPKAVLKGSIKSRRVFDDPYRSDRGRTITVAYHIDVAPDKKGLPKLKASSDAKSVGWYSLSEIKSDVMFEDHYEIIKAMTGVN